MKVFLKILVGILMLPIAIALALAILLVIGIGKAIEFAYGDIEFVAGDEKK